MTFRLSLTTTAMAALAAIITPRTASALSGAPGCTFTLSRGSAVLHHPTITMIFWGSGWAGTNGNTTSLPAMIADAQDIVAGPYFSLLNQYGGIRVPRLNAQAPWYTATSPSSANGFSEADLINVINTEIDNGAVPPPDSQVVDNLYVVLTPSNTRDNDDSGAEGVHRATTHNGVTYPWAWVGEIYGNTTDPYTKMFVHEVAEALTDPFGSSNPGIVLSGSNCGDSDEICDVCNNDQTLVETQNGHEVQAYWSAADNKCVIPESYSSILQFNGSAFSSISSNAQKVYPGYVNGTPVLVATDTSDNVYLATGSPPVWQAIIGGAGGGMFAVGSDSIYSFALDGSAVFRWNGGTSWSSIGLPSGNTITGIYGGKYPAATDMLGRVWTWSASSNAWVAVAGTSNEVVELSGNGVSLNLLSKTYSGAWQYQGGGLTSVAIAGSSELFTGGGSNTLLGAAAFSGAVSYLDTYVSGSGWITLGTPGFFPEAYVVGGNGLFAFSADHTTVALANNPNVSNGGWTNFSAGTVTRLYGQGATLFGAGSVVF